MHSKCLPYKLHADCLCQKAVMQFPDYFQENENFVNKSHFFLKIISVLEQMFPKKLPLVTIVFSLT